ncbi:hypothetical protein GLOIN_2v1770416 [Rhizophagus clarus]|uniref:Uncharacterized protein n=1 Tax=Rhizophagus clarus TaxID=94130 RepID=A0A8H3LP66_9GLOM|nr:hypothetical protein GLOIN_2v1770416 [Rhizophagus clarus]
MSEVCELVPSQKGNKKLNIRGYLMAVAKVKKRARETRGNPIQIIQNNMVNASDEIRPSRNALRRRITHVRKAETLLEPQSVAEVNIPDSLKKH